MTEGLNGALPSRLVRLKNDIHVSIDGLPQFQSLRVRHGRKQDNDIHLRSQRLGFLHQQHIRSVLVEGGTKLHNSFLEENLWDEARVITATDCILGEGVEAPKMVSGRETESYRLMSDRITHYRNTADVKK
jgi:riboflavin biosynthesis pyrimidine reductase